MQGCQWACVGIAAVDEGTASIRGRRQKGGRAETWDAATGAALGGGVDDERRSQREAKTQQKQTERGMQDLDARDRKRGVNTTDNDRKLVP